jgi:nitrous oxide reductase
MNNHDDSADKPSTELAKGLLSRRTLLKSAATAAAVVGAGSLLAACGKDEAPAAPAPSGGPKGSAARVPAPPSSSLT